MEQVCKHCKNVFRIYPEDLDFYEKISPRFGDEIFEIPPPTLCSDCRHKRRISWRNERSLHHRKCSASGKDIIAQYNQEAAFPVYDNAIWWGDSWDGRDYARDFDFERPFFEQLMELRDQVPHFALAVASTTIENSEYVNHAGYLKNCYLVYNTDYADQCMYGKGVNRCFDCLDCFKIYDCEACYECMNLYNCQFCSYLWDCYNSSECEFAYNLIGCKNCFLCANLQNKQHYFENRKLSAQQWEKKVSEYKEKYSNEELLEMLVAAKSRSVVKWMNENNTENCRGDYLVNCKDCHDCYDCEYLENSKYCYDLKKGDGVSYENYDISAFGVGVVRCYEGSTVGYNANHCLFGENVWESNDVYYSMLCVNNCKNCFACVGLKKAEYCVFNKQYSKEQYESLVPKIIRHMQETGEWGEFFPAKYSPFKYEETMANEYYPSNIKQGSRPFKLQQAELDFYKKRGLPEPKLDPNTRHLKRLQFRNPRMLFPRKCAKCDVDLLSTYSEDRPEILHCGNCYREVVYSS